MQEHTLAHGIAKDAEEVPIDETLHLSSEDFHALYPSFADWLKSPLSKSNHNR